MNVVDGMIEGDDRDLLAAEPVERLVAAVYRDFAELEDAVAWAEHEADAAEAQVRQALARTPDPEVGAARLLDTVDACAATARAHLSWTVEAAAEQATAIVEEARARARELMRDGGGDGAAPAERALRRGPAADVTPRARHQALVETPHAATPAPAAAAPAPPARPDETACAGGDVSFDRFWAEVEAVQVAPPLLRIDGEVLLAALAVAVVVVLMLVLL